MTETGRKPMAPEKFDELFEDADEDNDGNLDLGELQAFIDNEKAVRAAKRAKKAERDAKEAAEAEEAKRRLDSMPAAPRVDLVQILNTVPAVTSRCGRLPEGRQKIQVLSLSIFLPASSVRPTQLTPKPPNRP